jgi:2-polyprenyl-6-methoxyphenol hydroxylase-like FAD-dependent oxidoreductase
LTAFEVGVGIVGAGPVGLALAARLAALGIPSVLLEAAPQLRKQGSKACLIQGDVLEVLDKFGCGDPIAAEGVTWTVARTYVRNTEIRATVFADRIGFGPFVNISQYRIEQILLARVESDPLCDVRWSHRVTGVDADADGVRLTAQTPTGPVDLRLKYVVACDGVRSVTRELVGVEWTGYTHQDRFLITDIRARLPLRQERHFHYDPSFNRGRQLVIHPQPDDVWRIDWQLPPDADIEEERRTGAFDERVRAVIGDVPYEVDWVSTYRFHQRVVDRFVVGRVFFAGDAAHALPPYGSRGMNSGIQDADNLAWKLALVLTDRADPGLLETYHAERYAAARENLEVTEATIRFMVPPNRPRRLARAVLLRLSRPFGAARRHVNSGRMAEPYVYTDSPLVADAGGHRLVGHFAPDGWIRTGGGRVRIRRCFGATFVVLYFGTGADAARRFVDEAGAGDAGLPVRSVLVLPAGTEVDGLPSGVTVVHDEDPALRESYAAHRPMWLLVRPDGHVAAAHDADDGVGVAEVLRHCALLRTDRAGVYRRHNADVAG